MQLSVPAVQVPALSFSEFALHVQKLPSVLDIDAGLQCIFLLVFFNLLYIFEFRGEQVQTLLSDAFRFFCHTK